MRTHSPLVLDVREVLDTPGVQKSVELTANVDIDVGMAKLEGDLDLDLTLEAIEGGVLVRGTIAGAYTGNCRRCLKPLSGTFDVKGSELYRPESEVWEEGYIVKEQTVDLEPMVRDTVGLALPVNPVCEEGCKGICPMCGADLNEGLCGCAPPTDHRWSALEQLRERLPSATREASESE